MKVKEFLVNFGKFIKENNYNTFDVAISSSANKVELLKLQDIDFLPDSYSVGKSFAVCACGLLYDEGKLDLNEPITNILKDDINYEYDKVWDTITVHDTLKHHIGIENNFLDIDCFDPKTFGDDYLRYVLQESHFVYKPKVDYTYTDAAYYLISRIVYKKANMDLKDYLNEKLFKNLDIKDFDWKTCPMGYSMGATGLLLSTLDMIKLPIMLLNDGVYNGKRILSKEWMKLLEDNEYENYNYLNSGWYLKGGMRNQMIMYNKEFDCAIAWHSLGLGYAEMRKFVVDNITSKLEY